MEETHAQRCHCPVCTGGGGGGDVGTAVGIATGVTGVEWATVPGGQHGCTGWQHIGITGWQHCGATGWQH